MYDICANRCLKIQTSKWLLYALLCLTWGSSFILMKTGLQHLTAWQVASIRILSAGVVVLPFTFKSWQRIPKNKITVIILSGLIGNFFPAYFYCLAETKIDSSLASIFNALTPLCAIVVGVGFFQLSITRQKIIGIIIGLIGLVLLPFVGEDKLSFENLAYASLILIATICYGTNVHVISRYLKELSSIDIAAVSLSCFIVPCTLILLYTDFFNLQLTESGVAVSVLASFTLGALGTALASVWFYILVKKAGSIFASLVTYGVPFIAVLWGLIFGEKVTVAETGCLLIILAGVYIVNRKNN